jgi:outer membrane protein assembly factor BamB/HEAT repeat protein
LGEIGGKEVVGPLEAALKDSDPRVARAAAEGLGAMGLVAKPAIPALAAALRHENEFVVYGAAGALMDLVPQAIGLDEAVTMIGQVVADGNVTVMARRKAADVLRLIGYDARPAVPLILPCLGEDDKELPMRVSEVIGQAGVDARSLPALMAMLKGGNPRAVTQAANVFSRLGAVGKAAVPDLVAVLARGGLDAASAAANALRRIGKDAGAAVPGLIELVSGADTKRAAMAARALGGIGADALPAIPVLEKAEAGPDKDLAEAAKGALGWLRYIKDGPKKGPPASSGPSAEWTANWPAFRGPDNSGVCRFKDIPDQWDEAQKKNIAWKVKIPLPGLSSPVVWGNRVYVTGATRQKREMYCFDGASGRLLWTGTYKSDPLAPTDYKVWQSRENALHASPTPVVDGQRVFGYYANGEVACFDAKTGRCLWSKYLGSPEGNTYGLSNSLLLYRNTLIVLFQGRNSRLVGLDAANGNEQWSSRQADASWASPLLLQGHGRAQIVVAANPHVSGWDAETGDNLWKAKLLKKGYAAPSPIVAGGKVFACLADCGMFAIKPEGKGDVTQTHVAWKIEDLENTGFPDATSPVSQGELVWVYSNEFLVCIDAKTGKVHYERDLGEGTSFASPMIAGGRLYAFGKTTTFVVEAGRVFKLSGKCKLSEPIDCSPAFAPGRIYVRTEGHLCAIGTAPPSPAAPPEPSISQSAEAGKPAHAETAKTVRTPTKPAPKEMTGRITVPPLPEPFKDGVSTVWHVRGVVLESEEKDPGGVEIRGVYKATLDEAGKQAARIIVYRDPWWHIRALRVETEQSGPDGKRRTASRVISPPDENRGRLGFSGPDAEFAIRGLLMAKPLRAEIVAAKEAGPETSQRFMVKQLAAYGKNLEIKPPGKTK